MSVTGLDTFVDNELGYFNIYVNTTPDTTGAIVRGSASTQAYVGQYIDNGTTKDAQQKLYLDVDISKSTFKTTYNGFYSGRLP